jgi:surface carbohydrate biosynthesis protein
MFFKRIGKLWRNLTLLAFSRKVWSWPRKSRVLIFDACGQDILMDYLEPWNPEVLHVRGEEINVRVLLKSLSRGGSREDAYVDCFIEKARPSLVVTFSDNHSGFHSIAARNPDIATLFIQNGIREVEIYKRLASRTSLESSVKVNYMMTFGDCVSAEYSKYIQGCAISMGSVKNNHIPNLRNKQNGMMILVSQWEVYAEPWKSYFEKAYDLVLPWLVSYAKEKRKRLMVLLRSPVEVRDINSKHADLLSQEKAYFRSLMGSETEFFESKDCYSSYQAIDSAEVVVTLHSTLGYESIARGIKTAHFGVKPKYLDMSQFDFNWVGGFVGEGTFYTETANLDSFVRILDHLFEIDDVQWQKDLEDINFSSFMVYDPGNTQLKSILEKELGLPPETKDIATSVQIDSVEAGR